MKRALVAAMQYERKNKSERAYTNHQPDERKTTSPEMIEGMQRRDLSRWSPIASKRGCSFTGLHTTVLQLLRHVRRSGSATSKLHDLALFAQQSGQPETFPVP